MACQVISSAGIDFSVNDGYEMIVGLYRPDNVREAIIKRGLTFREVAKRAGMEPPALSRILSGSGDLHVSTLGRLAEAIPCDPAEFFGGQRDRLREKDAVVVFPRTQAERDKLGESERPEHFIPVPLLADPASLGPGLTIEEANVEGYCLIYKDWLGKGRHYAIRVKGESMTPTLNDGDIVAVDLSDINPKSLRGKVIAAKVGDGVTIKRFVVRAGDRPWYFQADNAEWERENGQITAKPKDGLILGKVVWAWRRMG